MQEPDVICISARIDDRGGIWRELTAFLRERREGMYALVLESADLDPKVSVLLAKGVGLGDSPPILHSGRLIPPRSTGARIRIEPRSAV